MHWVMKQRYSTYTVGGCPLWTFCLQCKAASSLKAAVTCMPVLNPQPSENVFGLFRWRLIEALSEN